MNITSDMRKKQGSPRLLRWSVLLIMVLLLGLSALTIRLDYANKVAAATSSSMNHAKVLQVQYEASFRRLSSVLSGLSRQIPEAAMRPDGEQVHGKAVQAILDNSLIDFAEVTAIRVVDANGEVRYSSPYTTKRGVNSADREFFIEQKHNPTPHLFFSRIITSRVLGTQTMVVSRSMRNARGEFLGVVTAGIALDQIQAQFRRLDVGKNGSIAIRRSDNLELIVRWPHFPAQVNEPLAPNNLLVPKIRGTEKQFSLQMIAQADGIMRIFGNSRMEQFPFFVTVAYDLNEVLASWRKQAWLIAGMMLATLTLLLELLRRFQSSQAREFAALRDLAKNQSRVRLLAQVFENSGEAILLLDKQERICEANPAYTRLTGNRLSQVQGQVWQTVLQAAAPNVAATLEADTELLCLRQDGSRFPVLHTSAVFLDEEGSLAYTIITFSDNTERKRVDQMKSEFVSTVSHELRTPLTSICGGLGLLAGGALGNLPDSTRKIVTLAHTNSLRLSALINDLLDMEKLTAGKMAMHLQPQALMPLIDAALEMNQSYAVLHQVSFHVVQRDDEVQVLVDAGRLGQVLSNLISNGAKFSHKNSRVEVRVAICTHGKQRRVRVAVQDYGIGVAQEFHDRIFQKFAQADSGDTRKHRGTGLGLAISKQLIEQMQGEIGFDSVAGEGSTFYFELPVFAPQMAGTSA
jgi:PAS domain S-box-containing protein